MADNQKADGKQIKEETFGVPLTKTAHRNPDLHQRGDSLPESLLEYQEGSATLNPDIAGNSPVMLRQSLEVIGNVGVNQNLNATPTQIANLSQVVVSPPQATGSPFIIVSAYLTAYALATGGGVTNYCYIELYANGVAVPGARGFYQREYALGVDLIPFAISPKKISMTPGQTLTVSLRGAQIVPAGFKQQYSASPLPDRSYMLVELYY